MVFAIDPTQKDWSGHYVSHWIDVRSSPPFPESRLQSLTSCQRLRGQYLRLGLSLQTARRPRCHMGRNPQCYHHVGRDPHSPLCANQAIDAKGSIIEFTAGIVVCCMPPAMAAVRTLRTSVSSLLAAHFFRTRGGAASSSSTSIHDNNKKVGIFAHLHDKRREAHKNMHPPCLGLEDSPSVWQLEDVVTQPIASATNFPPEEHRILKTTNIVDVERSNSSSLGHWAGVWCWWWCCGKKS